MRVVFLIVNLVAVTLFALCSSNASAGSVRYNYAFSTGEVTFELDKGTYSYGSASGSFALCNPQELCAYMDKTLFFYIPKPAPRIANRDVYEWKKDGVTFLITSVRYKSEGQVQAPYCVIRAFHDARKLNDPKTRYLFTDYLYSPKLGIMLYGPATPYVPSAWGRDGQYSAGILLLASPIGLFSNVEADDPCSVAIRNNISFQGD